MAKILSEEEYGKAWETVASTHYVPTPAGIGVGMAPFGPATTAPPPSSSTYHWTAPPVAAAPTALFLGTVLNEQLTIAVFGGTDANSFDIFIAHRSHMEKPWDIHLDRSGVWNAHGILRAVDYAIDVYMASHPAIAAELGITVCVPPPWNGGEDAYGLSGVAAPSR